MGTTSNSSTDTAIEPDIHIGEEQPGENVQGERLPGSWESSSANSEVEEKSEGEDTDSYPW